MADLIYRGIGLVERRYLPSLCLLLMGVPIRNSEGINLKNFGEVQAAALIAIYHFNE